MEIKEFTFNLPNELYDVLTEENIDEIADGIATTLKMYLAFVEISRQYTNNYESKNTEILPPQEMTWKNDGKKDFNLNIIGVKK